MSLEDMPQIHGQYCMIKSILVMHSCVGEGRNEKFPASRRPFLLRGETALLLE